MNSQEEKKRKIHNQPPEGLESPFLEGEFFVREGDEEGEARLGALEAESVFQLAFEESPVSAAEPEVYEEEWAREDEEIEADDTPYAEVDLEEEQDTTLEELYEAPIESEVFGTNDLDSVANTLDVPHRWICRLDIEYEITPWNTTRKLSGHGTGTGTLISPCHVLTAAHNITGYDPVQKNYLKAVRIRVTAAHDGSASPPIPSVDADLSRSNVHPRWRVQNRVGSRGAPNPAGEVETNRYDYALLTLKSSIGRMPVKVLGNCPLGYWANQVSCGFAHFERLDPNVLRNHKASIAGYAYDACVVAVRSARSNPNIPSGGQLMASGGLTLIWEGTRTRYLSQSMAHDVDTCGGQSGAPVWIKLNGIYYLVGVHTGAIGLTGGGRTNHAVRVTRGLIRQVNQWITKTRCPEQSGKIEREEAFKAETPHANNEGFEDYTDINIEDQERDEETLNEFAQVNQDEEFEEVELEDELEFFNGASKEIANTEFEDFDEDEYDKERDEEAEFVEIPDELALETSGGTGKSFTTSNAQHFVVLVAGYDYRSKGDSYGRLCRNRALLIKLHHKTNDNLVFIWFNIANGMVYVNQRKSDIWKLMNYRDWQAVDKIIFNGNPTTSKEFDYEAINWGRHYYKKTFSDGSWGWRFDPTVSNKVIGITDIYAFLSELGTHHPKSLIEFSVIGHSYNQGPILVNSEDRKPLSDPNRDPTDKDGRYHKDFNSSNMSTSMKTNIQNAFRDKGIIWIWGCQVFREARAVIQSLVKSENPSRYNYGQCVKGLGGSQYESNGSTNPSARFRYDFNNCILRKSQYPLRPEYLPVNSMSFDIEFSEIKKYALKWMRESYFAEIAKVFNKPCFAPAIGTSTNYGIRDPYTVIKYYHSTSNPGRFYNVPVPWVEQGKPYRASDGKSDPTKKESDFRPIIKFFTTEEFEDGGRIYKFEEDSEGRGFVKYEPTLIP